MQELREEHDEENDSDIDEEPDQFDKGWQDPDDVDPDSDNEEDNDAEDGAGVSNREQEEMDVDDVEIVQQQQALSEEERKKKEKKLEDCRAAVVARTVKQQRKRKFGQSSIRDKDGKFAPPPAPIFRKRDKENEVKAYDRERKRQSRMEKKAEKLDYFKKALAALDPAVNYGRIQPLIHTDADQFEAAGFASNILEFGSSTLMPYRLRARALHVWHRFVVDQDGAGFEEGYSVAAAAVGVHRNTVRKWVRSFHVLGFKIPRLLAGLNKKTSSYLDDEDIQFQARRSLPQGSNRRRTPRKDG